MLLNDIQSRLNPTEVASFIEVDSVEALQRAVTDHDAVALAGGFHAMGGQQLLEGGVVLDTRPLRQVLDFDPDRGLVKAEAGIQWPDLIAGIRERQSGDGRWGIAQKQTGADTFTIGGSLSVNGHGRGLTMPPLVADVEELEVVLPDGSLVRTSRSENPDLFALVIGGYGLVAAIATATLRLAPRQKLERLVEVITADRLIDGFRQRVDDGFLYGDFQFAIDSGSDDFLRRGIFSCYRPVDPDTPIPDGQRALSREDWGRLLLLAHTDKPEAWRRYSEHYLATSGQLYWSDLHQLSEYVQGYHEQLDAVLGSAVPASELLGEIYVPRERLDDFLAATAELLRREEANVIYGTIRLVERDEETFLPWAREPWVCTTFNLHTVHTEEGIEDSRRAFRGLTDLALERGGTYFLTYDRWATREQVLACHPRFPDFLAAKLEHDPGEVFQSEWYRYYRALLA